MTTMREEGLSDCRPACAVCSDIGSYESAEGEFVNCPCRAGEASA